MPNLGNVCGGHQILARYVAPDRQFSRAGGWYGVHDNVTDGPLTRADEQIKARITTWLVAQRRAGVACPELTSGVMEEMKRRAPMQAHERADRLLALLSEKSKTIGSFVILSGPDHASRVYPNLNPSEATAAISQVMITTESTRWEEVGFLANYLKSKKWIEELPPPPNAELGQWPRFVITVDGYSRLAELEKHPSTHRKPSSRCGSIRQ